ncbi:MAG TPA: methyltransferase domain-containing protein [Streptosporangiaceae bacterium]|nr:methyltransferase domain-containing protein [Streptosporangiaceae bacterium]
MLSAIIDYLICPVCGADVHLDGRSIRCASNHSFDIARQGYVNLLPGGAQAGTADTAAMVEARAAFLAEGHFASLARRLTDGVTARTDLSGDHARAPLIIDAGAGTGYYLSTVLDRCPHAVGAAIDISKFAIRKTARAHPRIGAVVADLWSPLPIRPAAADAILNVFAPRNPEEFHRVLRPDGALLVVSPTARHLQEVVRPLRLLTVDEDKAGQLDSALGARFVLVDRDEHEIDLWLSHPAVAALARMGPSAWHRTPADIGRRLAGLPEPLRVTASFTVSTYQAQPMTRP